MRHFAFFLFLCLAPLLVGRAQQNLQTDGSGNPLTPLNLGDADHEIVGLLANMHLNLTTGDTVWVDPVDGSDSTGALGLINKPFATLAGALSVAPAGCTIILHSGTYSTAGTTTVTTNGITILGYGAAIVATNQSDVPKINISGMNCSIYGLEINGSIAPSGNTASELRRYWSH